MKFLEVDVPKLEEKLIGIGAKKVGEYDFHRAIFDYSDWRMDKEHAHLRIRTDGKESTMTYKQRIGVKSSDGSIHDDGMKEIEIKISDYNKAYELLKVLGFVVKREEENKRIKYAKDDVIFDIDSWPQIPTYMEIESTSLEKVKSAALELGLKPQDGFICTASVIYKRYGINKNEYSYISFDKMIKK